MEACLAGEKIGPMAAACMYTAIARHHGPRTRECTIFRLHPEANSTVIACLPGAWRHFELQDCANRLNSMEFSDDLLTFDQRDDEDDEQVWPLYVFLVRRLRLADQASLRPR